MKVTGFNPYRLTTRPRFRQSAAVIALGLLTLGPVAQATDGDLDPAFGTGGFVTTDFNRSTDIA